MNFEGKQYFWRRRSQIFVLIHNQSLSEYYFSKKFYVIQAMQAILKTFRGPKLKGDCHFENRHMYICRYVKCRFVSKQRLLTFIVIFLVYKKVDINVPRICTFKYTRGHARFARIPLVIRLGDSRIRRGSQTFFEKFILSRFHGR